MKIDINGHAHKNMYINIISFLFKCSYIHLNSFIQVNFK